MTGQSFGWRHWTLSDAGELVSPYRHDTTDLAGTLGEHWGAARFTGNTYVCSCPHGNTPPSVECTCGIYYVDETLAFFTDTEAWYRYWRIPTHERAKVANVVTFGRAVGESITDRVYDNETWGDDSRPARRAAAYEVLGILFPTYTTRPAVWSAIRSLQVPFDFGMELPSGLRLEAVVRSAAFHHTAHPPATRASRKDLTA